MRNTVYRSIVICCVAIAFISAAPTTSPSRPQRQATTHPETERQRQQAEQSAQQTLDKDAVAAINETQAAVKALADGKKNEALAALERATGKINILTARNPQTALLPIDAEVEVIDTAPMDVRAIRDLAKAADKAIDDRDFPTARVILESLISEIRVRTYHLPLATYPAAMRDAARLLNENKTNEAQTLLQTALNTLVVIDHVTPLPIATAQVAINEAQNKSQQDKEQAKRLLAVAKQELQRAKELGYAGHDPEYAALDQAIDDVERQLNGNKDSGSAFARLKEKVSSFFKRQSDTEKKAQVASR
ncbi:MAG: hypothetical protein QOE14_2221 [Humisphaera sp.]|nr:hypothetical protein [Humisphaera sp.]